MRFGRKPKGGMSQQLIEAINPHADDIDGQISDMSLASSVHTLTVRALRESGFSDREADSRLVTVATIYAAHILMAAVRHGTAPPGGEVLDTKSQLEAYSEIRERIGMPALDAEVMSPEYLQLLTGVIPPDRSFPRRD